MPRITGGKSLIVPIVLTVCALLMGAATRLDLATQVFGVLTPANGGTGSNGITGIRQANGASADTVATAAQVQSAYGAPSPVYAKIEEDWLGGQQAVTGNLGTNGWSLVAIVAAPTFTTETAPAHPGIQVITSGATSGNGGTMYLAANTTLSLGTVVPWQSEWIADVPVVTAGAYRIGFMNTYSSTKIPTTGIYFRFDRALSDTTFMACVSNSGAETCTATSTTPVAGTYYDFNISSTTAGTISYNINGGTAVTLCASGCTAAATIPTAAVVPSVDVVATSAAATAIKLDYFQYYQSGLTR